MEGHSSDVSTELARERNRAAADRTLLAWIRTSLSLIGFGFGIGKFYDYLQTAGLDEALDPIRSTLVFGAGFIFLGILALFAAILQHVRIVSSIQQHEFVYAPRLPLGLVTAVLLLFIGAFGLIAIFL